MFQQEFGCLDLYGIVGIVVFSFPGEISPDTEKTPELSESPDITFCFRIGGLYIICQQELGKEPGGQNFLGIFFVKDTKGRSLGDHLRILRSYWGIGMTCGFKPGNVFLRNVYKGSVASHPGGGRQWSQWQRHTGLHLKSLQDSRRS